MTITESTKICKMCGNEKTIDSFRVNTRMCISCQDNYTTAYMKNYYQNHKKRLIKKNLDSYYEKNPIRKKMGRPRIYEAEQDNILSC